MKIVKVVKVLRMVTMVKVLFNKSRKWRILANLYVGVIPQNQDTWGIYMVSYSFHIWKGVIKIFPDVYSVSVAPFVNTSGGGMTPETGSKSVVEMPSAEIWSGYVWP